MAFSFTVYGWWYEVERWKCMLLILHLVFSPLIVFWFLQVNFFCAYMMCFGWYSAFRLSPNRSYPRRKTSIQMFRLCSGNCFSASASSSSSTRNFCTAHIERLYIHFRNRPIQSIFQQQSLEAHKRILPLPVVWLIPCGSYGQCLSQPFWAYSQTDIVLSFGSLMVSKSHPPFAMKWKVCIPLSAPYLYGKVWFVAGIWKNFWKNFGYKKARTKHIVLYELLKL